MKRCFVLCTFLFFSFSLFAKSEKQTFQLMAIVSPKTSVEVVDEDVRFSIEDKSYTTHVHAVRDAYLLTVIAS